MRDPRAKFFSVRKPFDYRMAKIRTGVIKGLDNIGKGIKALKGKYEHRYK
jgi:hypothetical protein